MFALIIILLCALGFFIYLADKNNNEISKLKDELAEKENFSTEFKDSKSQPQPVKKSSSKKRFVKVIFKKDAPKSYDYFIGDFEVKVGDFVVVHISDKSSGKIKLRAAQIIYISAPGEVSQYANSKIFKKAAKNKW